MFSSRMRMIALVLIYVMAFAYAPGSLAIQSESGKLPVDTGGANALVIADASSGAEMASLAADEKMEVAGLARLPALIVLAEAVDSSSFSLDNTVTISAEAAAVKGPTAFVEAYEKISARELFKAAVMISAGDAIYALAEAYAGSAGAFIALVNERLQIMGVAHEYASLAGENERFSARELIEFGAALAASPSFLSYSNVYMDQIVHESGLVTELVNPNRLVRTCTGCIGAATGSSQSAGYCGLFIIKRSESVYLCSLIGANNSSDRFETAQKLIEYAFTAFRSEVLANQGQVIVKDVPVQGGSEPNANLIAANNAALLVEQGTAYERTINAPNELVAPLTQGEVYGKAEYHDQNGTLLAVVELTVAESIPCATIWDHVARMLQNWVHR